MNDPVRINGAGVEWALVADALLDVELPALRGRTAVVVRNGKIVEVCDELALPAALPRLDLGARILVRLAPSVGCQNRETLAQKRGGDVYCGRCCLENSDEAREDVDHAFPNMNCRVDAGDSCLFT